MPFLSSSNAPQVSASCQGVRPIFSQEPLLGGDLITPQQAQAANLVQARLAASSGLEKTLQPDGGQGYTTQTNATANSTLRAVILLADNGLGNTLMAYGIAATYGFLSGRRVLTYNFGRDREVRDHTQHWR